MNAELLLSEKFLEFSQKIAVIHEKKKSLLVEFKKQYEAHKAQVKSLEEEAAALAAEFEQAQQPQQ
jgi:hypothetical protein